MSFGPRLPLTCEAIKLLEWENPMIERKDL